MDTYILKTFSGYRISIPKKTREKLGIKIGDYVEVVFLRKIEKTNQILERV